MNPESIQQLISMIGQAGDGAKDAFIWYLVALTVPKLFGLALGLVIAILAYVTIKYAIHKGYKDSEWRANWKDICDHLNISYYSCNGQDVIKAINKTKEK